MSSETTPHPTWTSSWSLQGGEGQDLEMDVRTDAKPWIAVGPGFDGLDLWMKSIAGADLRVAVVRRGNRLQVTIDRGETGETWWSPTAAPQLTIEVDAQAGTIAASATVGSSDPAGTTARITSRIPTRPDPG